MKLFIDPLQTVTSLFRSKPKNWSVSWLIDSCRRAEDGTTSFLLS